MDEVAITFTKEEAGLAAAACLAMALDATCDDKLDIADILNGLVDRLLEAVR